MEIKVCGMREEENIRSVLELEPDFMGLIFYPKSPRFISAPLPELSKNKGKTKIVGVFVNATLEEVEEKIAIYSLDVVQLHGKESPEFCNACQELGVKVWKVFSVGASIDFGEMKPYLQVTDAFLFDTKTTDFGGSGRQFSWELLRKFPFEKPFYLSGGLNSGNVDQALGLDIPWLKGMDVNSGFEFSPGLKNVEALKQAFEKIKKIKL